MIKDEKCFADVGDDARGCACLNEKYCLFGDCNFYAPKSVVVAKGKEEKESKDFRNSGKRTTMDLVKEYRKLYERDKKREEV